MKKKSFELNICGHTIQTESRDGMQGKVRNDEGHPLQKKQIHMHACTHMYIRAHTHTKHTTHTHK